MDAVCRKMMDGLRTAGMDVFVLPDPNARVKGSAFRVGRRLCINIYTDQTGPELAHLLLHELAHHAFGHTSVRSYQPKWVDEYEAERFALDGMYRCYGPDIAYGFDQRGRDYIRRMVQPMLDVGVYNHGELDAAVWAGIQIDADTAAQMELD